MEKMTNKADPQKWLERYGNLLFQYTLPRVNDRGIAEDLVQETFLSALKGLDTYRGDASEKNWLVAILRNKIIDYFRKKSKDQAISAMPDLQQMEENWFDADGHWTRDKMPREWNAADNPAERKEIQKIIHWCKTHLKNLQQQVFVLKYMEDLDSEEICKVLNISASNYWVLIHRARLQMRDCVEKHWLKEGGL